MTCQMPVMPECGGGETLRVLWQCWALAGETDVLDSLKVEE